MASPCEILIQNRNEKIADEITKIAQQEAQRIETKFSRFQKNNIIYKINHAHGGSIKIDAETHKLLSFANDCFHLSDGLFDITSGVLKQIWNFKQLQSLPSEITIIKALENVGWDKVELEQDSIKLPHNMQIDLGGIGKEYAVDRVALLLKDRFPEIDILVNFGGDLCTTAQAKQPWKIGIEGFKDKIISLQLGAIATSGKTKQYFVHDNKRYSHLINPITGWPVQGSPLSITVMAENATQAGMLATFAQLQGDNAEDFLESQKCKYWCIV